LLAAGGEIRPRITFGQRLAPEDLTAGD